MTKNRPFISLKAGAAAHQHDSRRITRFSGEARSTGFTVVEIAIVLVVILTIIAIAVPRYTAALNQARIDKASNELQQISLVIQTYRQDNGMYPTDLSQVNYSTMVDPWGRPYSYLPLEGGINMGHCRKDHSLNPINSDFDVYSKGPDGQSVGPLTANPSKDDVIRANNGGYFGLASLY